MWSPKADIPSAPTLASQGGGSSSSSGTKNEPSGTLLFTSRVVTWDVKFSYLCCEKYVYKLFFNM